MKKYILLVIVIALMASCSPARYTPAYYSNPKSARSGCYVGTQLY